MKKATVTLLLFLFFFVSKAQVTEFLSLRSTTAEKDSKGNFVPVKSWLVQQTRINFDLTRQKIQFFSKGLLDRDTLTLIKEIFIVSGTTIPDTDMEKTIREFSGIDKAGRKCTVTLKLMKDEYKVQNGEVRIEYTDHAEIFKVRAFTQTPMFNKG